MKHFARKFRGITAFGSFVCFYLAASTSDYYVMELRQSEPESVGALLAWGLVLLVPMGLHLIWEGLKMGLRNAYNR